MSEDDYFYYNPTYRIGIRLWCDHARNYLTAILHRNGRYQVVSGKEGDDWEETPIVAEFDNLEAAKVMFKLIDKPRR